MKPKKSLGQNFLTSEAAIYKITSAASLSNQDTVLEVGPGKGVLTKALLATGAKVVAVEKDDALADKLREDFSSEISLGSLIIHKGDILEFEAEDLGLEDGKYKIVANIPYYITGQFLRKFLSTEIQPSKMVLLLQKEVVERIIAQDKKESLLSLSVKAYGNPKKVSVVSRGSFFPAPNVDSAIILIDSISKKYFEEVSEKVFFDVIKSGFAHKRKVLISNLAENFEKETVLSLVDKNLIEKNTRAEDVDLDQWKEITRTLEKNRQSE